LATSVASTNDTPMPWLMAVCHRLLVLPNKKDDDTTWSPARSSACTTAPMAPMPVAKQIVPTPCSILLTLSSSAEMVGLPWRP
jgi:hypothetical protein